MVYMIYHLVIEYSYGKSVINEGFNGKSFVNGPFSIAMFVYTCLYMVILFHAVIVMVF